MASYYDTTGYGSQRPTPPPTPPRMPGTLGGYAGSNLSSFGAGFTQQGGPRLPGVGAGDAQPKPATPAIPDLSGLDYSNDPILQRIRAMSQAHIDTANADALAARRQLAIGYGDPELAAKLGLGGKTAKQAGDNTFGTQQELQRGYERRNVFDINRPLSDHANLFYSTERTRQLALSGEQFLRDKYNAQAAVQQRLAEISQQVAQAKMQAQSDQMQAEQDAWARAIQQANYSVGVG